MSTVHVRVVGVLVALLLRRLDLERVRAVGEPLYVTPLVAHDLNDEESSEQRKETPDVESEYLNVALEEATEPEGPDVIAGTGGAEAAPTESANADATITSTARIDVTITPLRLAALTRRTMFT